MPLQPGPGIAQAASTGGLEAVFEAELPANTECHDVHLATKAFGSVATPADIRKFLQQCPLYNSDERRWITIPERPTEEAQLYRPLIEILSAIVSDFGLSASRVVHDTHDTQLGTVVKGQDIICGVRYRPDFNSPSICVRAAVQDSTMPNNFPFYQGQVLFNTQYFMVVFPVKVMTEKEFSDVEKGVYPRQNRALLYLYARQIFLQQGNRFFVNCFLLTESGVRLYVFARDGLVYSSKVNIHKSANIFVKLILGAASNVPEFVGFDGSVFWQNRMRYIRTVDENKNPITYKLLPTSVMPVVDHRYIRGRGTCGWRAIDHSGAKSLFIKDSWHHPGLHSEAGLLEDVKGCSGVGQMLARQDRIISMSELRNVDVTNMSSKMGEFFRDKQFSRIVFEGYGSPISEFDSRRSVLCALYDAINGHRNLLKRGILHRDISPNNILIGSPFNAVFPNRGILIDLDMAIRLEDMNASAREVHGTRPYLSLSMLKRFVPHAAFWRPRDYMDDLESFFYVLNISEWNHLGETDLYISKLRLYGEGADNYFQVTEYFGEIFRTLIRGLFYFFKDHIDNSVLSYPGYRNNFGAPPWYTTRTSPPDAAYAIVLGLFNQAIISLDLELNAQYAINFNPLPSNPILGTHPDAQFMLDPYSPAAAVLHTGTRRQL